MTHERGPSGIMFLEGLTQTIVAQQGDVAMNRSCAVYLSTKMEQVDFILETVAEERKQTPLLEHALRGMPRAAIMKLRKALGSIKRLQLDESPAAQSPINMALFSGLKHLDVRLDSVSSITELDTVLSHLVSFSMTSSADIAPHILQFLQQSHLKNCSLHCCLNDVEWDLFPSTLEKLDLSHNQLRGICVPMGCLSQLQSLSLQENNIVSVTGLDSLTQLTSLDLSNNRLETLSAITCLQRMPQLRQLWLHGCPISQRTSYRTQCYSLLSNPHIELDGLPMHSAVHNRPKMSQLSSTDTVKISLDLLQTSAPLASVQDEEEQVKVILSRSKLNPVVQERADEYMRHVMEISNESKEWISILVQREHQKQRSLAATQHIPGYLHRSSSPASASTHESVSSDVVIEYASPTSVDTARGVVELSEKEDTVSVQFDTEDGRVHLDVGPSFVVEQEASQHRMQYASHDIDRCEFIELSAGFELSVQLVSGERRRYFASSESQYEPSVYQRLMQSLRVDVLPDTRMGRKLALLTSQDSAASADMEIAFSSEMESSPMLSPVYRESMDRAQSWKDFEAAFEEKQDNVHVVGDYFRTVVEKKQRD